MLMAGEMAGRLELCGGLYGVSEASRAWVMMAGEDTDSRYLQRRRARANKSEGDYRGRPGMGNNGQVWAIMGGVGEGTAGAE